MLVGPLFKIYNPSSFSVCLDKHMSKRWCLTGSSCLPCLFKLNFKISPKIMIQCPPLPYFLVSCIFLPAIKKPWEKTAIPLLMWYNSTLWVWILADQQNEPSASYKLCLCLSRFRIKKIVWPGSQTLLGIFTREPCKASHCSCWICVLSKIYVPPSCHHIL